jgi:hypothetical protein
MPPSIPDAPSYLSYVLYQAVAITIFATFLPFVLVYRTLRHLVPSLRPYPTWSVQRDLALAAGRLYMNWSTRFCLPAAPGKESWSPHKFIHRMIGKVRSREFYNRPCPLRLHFRTQT